MGTLEKQELLKKLEVAFQNSSTHAIYRRTDKKNGSIEYVIKSLNIFASRKPTAILHEGSRKFDFKLVKSKEQEISDLSLTPTQPLQEATTPKRTRKKTATKADDESK